MTDIAGKNILFVDDETDLVEVVEILIRKEKCNFASASNAKEAFEKIKKEPFDIVITDYSMQGASGIDLIQQISREINPPAACILLTGNNENSIIERAYSAGASLLLFKPINRQDLVAGLRLALMPKELRWQRNSSRCDLEAEGIFTIVSNSSEYVVEDINISHGGLFIGVPDSVLPQTNQEIQFSLELRHESEPYLIQGIGIVRWTRNKANERGARGLGIEFTGLDDDSANNVNTIVTKQTTKAFIPSSK